MIFNIDRSPKSMTDLYYHEDILPIKSFYNSKLMLLLSNKSMNLIDSHIVVTSESKLSKFNNPINAEITTG